MNARPIRLIHTIAESTSLGALAGVLVCLIAVLPGTLAAASATSPAPAPATGSAPVCRYASHDRLVVRPGRDVCASTLSAMGKPAAAGLLPTQCPEVGDEYLIDAAETEDRCLAASTKPHVEGTDP